MQRKMKQRLVIGLLITASALTFSCAKRVEVSAMSVTEAANDPDKFKGKRVRWTGKAFGEIKAGDSQPIIIAEAGYWVIPKTSHPIAAYASDTRLVVEGIYEGVSGNIGTFSAGGSPIGGAKMLIVKDATVSPAP